MKSVHRGLLCFLLLACDSGDSSSVTQETKTRTTSPQLEVPQTQEAITPPSVTSVATVKYEPPRPSPEVYICNGPSSRKYHYNDDCNGLRNCSTDLERISVADAKNMERGLCGFED